MIFWTWEKRENTSVRRAVRERNLTDGVCAASVVRREAATVCVLKMSARYGDFGVCHGNR